jgi:ribosomal protein L3
MSLGLVGRKVGMTRIFTDDGSAVPVTVLDVEVVPDVEAARAWFSVAKITRPWEQRQ